MKRSGSNTMRLFAVGILLLCAGQALADVGLVYLGYDDIGGGQYDHQYKLSNIGGSVDLYDFHVNYTYSSAWLYATGPDGWAAAWEDPFVNWATDSAPCSVEYETGEWHVYAGTPLVGDFYVEYTDVNHSVVSGSMVPLPLPEPCTVSLLVLGGIAMMRRRR